MISSSSFYQRNVMLWALLLCLDSWDIFLETSYPMSCHAALFSATKTLTLVIQSVLWNVINRPVISPLFWLVGATKSPPQPELTSPSQKRQPVHSAASSNICISTYSSHFKTTFVRPVSKSTTHPSFAFSHQRGQSLSVRHKLLPHHILNTVTLALKNHIYFH